MPQGFSVLRNCCWLCDHFYVVEGDSYQHQHHECDKDLVKTHKSKPTDVDDLCDDWELADWLVEFNATG